MLFSVRAYVKAYFHNVHATFLFGIDVSLHLIAIIQVYTSDRMMHKGAH